jgi:hypothetical protein
VICFLLSGKKQARARFLLEVLFFRARRAGSRGRD